VENQRLEDLNLAGILDPAKMVHTLPIIIERSWAPPVPEA
jgi:hypothetical protein